MTLVELMIGVAVLAFLLMSGAPAFSDWIRNLRIRSASESILSGIQYARSEAVRRNTTARFQLTDSLSNGCTLSTTGLSWVVTMGVDNSPQGHCGAAPDDNLNGPRVLQKNEAATNTGLVAVTLSRFDLANAPSIAFNSMGQQIPVDGVAVNRLISIDIGSPQGQCARSNGTGGSVRCLRIEVSRGGQVRLCDPGIAANADSRAMACQVPWP